MKLPIETLKKAYVNVPVAVLWKDAKIVRDMDFKLLTKQTKFQEWVKSMNYDEKLWLVGKVESQVLFGTKVIIQEELDDWVKVVIPSQPTNKNPLGYPGWVLKEQLIETADFEHEDDKKVIVNKPKTWLYMDVSLTKRDHEVSFNTHLPVKKIMKDTIEVRTPGGYIRWIALKDARVVSRDKLTGMDILNTGKLFLGLEYLWGGMSGYGFDCSGLAHTLHQFHGITIPRDASEQAIAGKVISREELREGDLLFFAYDEGKGTIHHVSIYAGNDKMLHAPKTGLSVEEIDIWTSNYAIEYAGARRYYE